MHPSDGPRFAMAMTRLAATLMTPRLDEVVVREFFEELQDYDLELVLEAFRRARGGRWYPFPKPVDLKDLIEEQLEERRQEREQLALPPAIDLTPEQIEENLQRVRALAERIGSP